MPHSCSCKATASGGPYLTDTFTSINSANWYQNGTLTASAGLTSSAVNGGSLISKIDRTVQNPDYRYEVRTGFTLSGSGGTFVQYLRATPDALIGPSTSQGTFYAIEMRNPAFDAFGNCSATLMLRKRQNNQITDLSQQQIGCWSGMDIRTIQWASGMIVIYVGDFLVINHNDRFLSQKCSCV